MRNATGRVKYWDVAKGITIIFVIMGHIRGVNPIVRRMIFSYHMPFFFIANAFFIKDYNLGNNIRKSTKSLIIPYAVVCLISAVLCVNQNTSEIPDYSVFLKRIVDMFIRMSKISTHFQQFESVWLVWFVICLYGARIIYVILMSQLKEKHLVVQVAILLMIATLGGVIGKYYAFMPWSIDVSLVALPLMWFGECLSHFHLVEMGKRWTGFAALSVVVWAILVKNGIQIEMATRRYPGYYLSYMAAVCGSIMIIYLSQITERMLPRISEFFSWCGRNSMIILAFHCLEMRFFNWD